MATEVKEQIFPKLYASGIDYLDALTCGSAIGFKIVGYSYSLDCTVDLSDCNRTITWSFSDNENGLDKIDAAIGMLTDFRKSYVEARRGYKKDLAQNEI